LWDSFIQELIKFLNKFIGKPSGESGGIPWSLEQVIRYESTHFLLSLFLGWLVFSLTLTILSYIRPRWSDHYIFHTGLLFALVVSVTTHMLIDGFTKLC